LSKGEEVGEVKEGSVTEKQWPDVALDVTGLRVPVFDHYDRERVAWSSQPDAA
jgi:hypothetical protein